MHTKQSWKSIITPRLVREKIDHKKLGVSIGVAFGKLPSRYVADPSFFIQHCPDMVDALSAEDNARLKYLHWLSQHYAHRRQELENQRQKLQQKNRQPSKQQAEVE